MYKFEEDPVKSSSDEFTIDRLLTALLACLHIAIAVTCFVIFSKLDAAFKALDISAGEEVSTELVIFNIVTMFAALANIASAISVIYRQYKREKYEKTLTYLYKKNSLYEEALREIKDDINELNSVKCKKCGTTHPAGTKFCQNCGQQLIKENKTEKAE